MPVNAYYVLAMLVLSLIVLPLLEAAIPAIRTLGGVL